jgi:manganese oxidase
VEVRKRLIVCGMAGALLASNPAASAAAQDVRKTTMPDDRADVVAGAVAGAVADVVANDNTRAAGVLDHGTVTIRLRAAAGQWRPEGPGGPALAIEAFGVEGAPLSVPAPLIRVTEGTTIAVSIRNELATPLRVHGLCARDGGACAPVDVPSGVTRDVRFSSGRAGTYHYWATAMGAPMPFRELAGALVVDPPGGRSADDRIFVITEWTNLTFAQLGAIITADDANAAFLAARPKLTFVINGLSWPATERLTYRRGESVRWRLINLSSQTHPMHLHGFYFTVTHTGDGRSDQPVAGGAGRRVVTQVMPSGGTLSMEWTPEREGNWLFHCHIMSHVWPERRLGADPLDTATDAHDAHRGQAAHGAQHGAHPTNGAHVTPATHGAHGHAQHDPSLGMAGMVLGITVLPASETPRSASRLPEAAQTPRKLTMVIQPGAATADGRMTAGFTVSEAGRPLGDATVISPGPALVLQRDEPVEITVVNRLAEATSMHWHGLELDSYYDGVHGWSGISNNAAQRVAPMIEPGASFIVRITPPRAGTFIYHTHLHDYRQLSSGLYGPLLVTEPGETYDAATDHVVVLGRRHSSEASSIREDAESLVVNGERAPQLVWRAGVRNRVRVINITPDDIVAVSLVARDTPVTWRPLTKDGAPVPEAEARPIPAKVRIAVGETYDFEYDAPAGRATLWLDVRTSGGKWLSQARVIVK